MAFMGNNFNRFTRDVTRMEVAASDVKLREVDREQSAKDHGSRIAAHLAMLIGVLLMCLFAGTALATEEPAAAAANITPHTATASQFSRTEPCWNWWTTSVTTQAVPDTDPAPSAAISTILTARASKTAVI